MTHTSRVPLRWSDIDALGHVNNAVYLTLCEQARTEALGALMPGGWAGAVAPVLVSAGLVFRRPITRVGVAVVEATFDAPGRTSLPTRYRVSLEGDDGGVCAEGEATLVWVDVATGRPVPVPDAVRSALGAGTSPADPA
jgi:acyl-CoA thioester hydrolase